MGNKPPDDSTPIPLKEWVEIKIDLKERNIVSAIEKLKEFRLRQADDLYGDTILHVAAELLPDSETKALDTEIGSLRSAIAETERDPVNFQNKAGRTPLHVAVFHKKYTFVKCFIEHKIHSANVNCVDRWGVTPLHIAAEKDWKEAIELLADNGANVNKTDYNLETPMHWAARNLSVNAVKELLNREAKANEGNSKRETPLMTLEGNTDHSSSNYDEIFSRLIEAGAVPTDKSKALESSVKMFIKKDVHDANVDIIERVFYCLEWAITCEETIREPPNKKQKSRRQKISEILKDDFKGFEEKIQSYMNIIKLNCVQAPSKATTGKYLIAKKINQRFLAQGKSSIFSRADIYFHSKIFQHHCCSLRFFSLFGGILSSGSYVVDLFTDIYVTVLNMTQGSFSTKLNIFMIFLIAFGFIHENIQSGLNLYRTEKKILVAKFGGRKLSDEDWKDSNVKKNLKKGGSIQSLWNLAWPYKSQRKFSLETFHNILTLFFLRPVVDSLRIAIHKPMSVQEYYRRLVNRLRLAEFYMIIERIPQFIIQLYTFHILMNNLVLSASDITLLPNPLDTTECSQYFNYPRFTEKINSTLKIFDKDVRFGEIGLRVFSLIITMVCIILRPVNMEWAIRMSDPHIYSSFKQAICYTISCFLMINGRLLVIPAMMHSLENMPLFFGYMIANTLLRFFINVVRCNIFIKKSNQAWRLLLLSFRDFFWVSLRKPDAYIKNPTKVRYHTLRSKYDLAAHAIFHLLEGIFCAVHIDSYYPCGRYSHIFRLTGWLGLSMYQLSFTLLLPLADWLHPEKTIPGQSNSNKSVAYLMIFLNAIMSLLLYGLFHVGKVGNERLLIVMGIPNISIIVLTVIFLKFIFS